MTVSTDAGDMTSADPQFSIIIVAYNSAPVLARCLSALDRQSHKSFEVLIVDNGANGAAVEEARKRNPDIRVLASEGNIGFAAANNLAAREARADWLVLLNPDAFAHPDWLARIRDAIREYPGATMFGSTQLRADRPEILDGAGDHYHPLGLAWRGGEGDPAETVDRDVEVFGPCAAAAVYRRDAFERAGGFAQRFFCYYEDVDLAFRLRLAGETCVQLADARVDHVGSTTAGAGSDFIRYHVTRNRVWTFLRCMPTALLILLAPPLIASLIARVIIAAISGGLGSRWRAVRDAASALPEVMEERRAIQSERRLGNVAVARLMTWSVGKLILRARDGRSLPVEGGVEFQPSNRDEKRHDRL